LSYLTNFSQGTLPQKGGEVNLTLGGIDLNNSGRYAGYCSSIIKFHGIIELTVIFFVCFQCCGERG